MFTGLKYVKYAEHFTQRGVWVGYWEMLCSIGNLEIIKKDRDRTLGILFGYVPAVWAFADNLVRYTSRGLIQA